MMFRISLASILLCAFAGLGTLLATPPAWWGETALDGSDPATDENYVAANLGQAKWMATLAYAAMEEQLPGGAGFDLSDVFPTPPENPGTSYLDAQYKPLNLGQLKHMAKPFYDRLEDLGYDNRSAIKAEVMTYLPGWSHRYPWDPTTPITDNFKAANVGQLKMVFSFDIAAAASQPTYKPIVWTNLVGAVAGYQGGSGSTLEKTTAITGWNSGAASVGIMPADGSIRFKVSPLGINKGIFVGLSRTNPNTLDTTVESAVFFNHSGGVRVYNSGNDLGLYGSYTTANVFEISREGSDVKFRRDGSVFKTITLQHSASLLVDTAFDETGGEIIDCEGIGLYSPGQDGDNDGVDDWWEVANGFDPNNHADSRSDGDSDGFSAYEEFLAGTDPDSAASNPTSSPSPFILLRPTP